MNSRAQARRRFRVVARPQVRARRARLFGAACVVVLLGAIAAAVARHAAGALSRAGLTLSFASGTGAVLVEGAPEPLRALAQEAADATEGSAGEKAAALRRLFPCLADVSVRRAWGEQRATLTPVLRRALAPALRRGKPAGFLGADGVVFVAPAGLYALSGPTVDVADADESERKALAHEWPSLTAPGAFSSPLVEMLYVSEDVRWEARLADGTFVLWGRLDWTKEKLSRLNEALVDARRKSPGTFAADLRYFEDGKVLLRPHGGVR